MLLLAEQDTLARSSPRCPMLLSSGNEFVGCSAGFAQGVVDLAGDVALDAAHDLVFGFAFGQAASEVVAGGRMTTHADHQDHVQGTIGGAVASPVESVADCFAAGCFQWADSAEFGESGVGADPARVVAEGSQ